jgi:hypothetical protein
VAESVERLCAPFIGASTAYIKSFERDGIQERFAKSVWKKTRDGEIWALAKKMGSNIWENITGGGNGSDNGSATPR